MIKLKLLLGLTSVLCFVAADEVPRVSPPVHGVPRPMPRPMPVRPLAVKPTTSSTVQEIPEAKPMPAQRSAYSLPPQRVNLRPNYAPPGAPRPYPKPLSVSTVPPTTEAPVEELAPMQEELPAEEAQLISSTIIPVEQDVVVTETPLTATPVPARPVLNYGSRLPARSMPYDPVVSIAPAVTEPNPTTVVDSQSIAIKSLPTDSGLEWASSQPTLEELEGESEKMITAPELVPTPAPIKPVTKPRPSFSIKSKPAKAMSAVIKQKPRVRPVGAVKPVQKKILATSLGMTCAAENGYFPAGQDCDSYIECKKSIPIEYICPDGLHFNPESLWPNYPCGYPSEVQCAGRTSKHEPHPTEDCPRQYGFFPMDSADCSKYIMCQEGKATVMDCPPGLAFSIAVNGCDWPENVPACNPGVFQGFRCPEAPLEDGKPSDLIINYKYGDSCKSYVACQRGRPRLLSCDEGSSFDNISARCIESDYVKNCEL